MVHVVVIGNVYNNKNCRKIYLSNLKILTATQRGSKGWFTCVFVDSMYHVECPRIPLLHSCLVLVFLKIFLKEILSSLQIAKIQLDQITQTRAQDLTITNQLSIT